MALTLCVPMLYLHIAVAEYSQIQIQTYSK